MREKSPSFLRVSMYNNAATFIDHVLGEVHVSIQIHLAGHNCVVYFCIDISKQKNKLATLLREVGLYF